MRLRKRLPSVLQISVAALLTTTLSACVSGNQEAIKPAAVDQSTVKRQLPNAPGWLVPVAAPQHRAGDDMIVIADREKNARKLANGIIVRAKSWYAGVRRGYAGGGK